jgi:UPF0755 protein
MSTEPRRNRDSKPKQAADSAGKSGKGRAKKTAQEELFKVGDYSMREYLPLHEEGGSESDDERGSGLEPSSRATRLRAHEAAVEALYAETSSGRKTGKSPPEKPAKPAAAGTAKQTAKVSASAPRPAAKTKAAAGRKKPSRPRRLTKKQLARRRELKKFALISAILLTLAALTVLLALNNRSRYAEMVADTPIGEVPVVETDTPFPDEVRIYIEPGMRAKEVSDLLVYAKVVDSGGRLLRYLSDSGFDTAIRSGLIYLPRGMEVSDAAQALVRGYWEHPIITVYDGYTISQVDDLLVYAGLAGEGEFTEAAGRIAGLRNLPFIEGFFYPDTYTLASVEDAAEVLAQQMYDQFLRISGPLEEPLRVQGRTLEEAVIVASMVQRETNAVEEMPLIAGIIWKRLDEGIPLGIDATTRYELDDWSSPIPREALESLTPYNTRRKRGLPPTGISNPGFDALQAAVYPQSSPYYYYLHDLTGTIHFAVTYEEHLVNVREYLR